MLTMWKSNRLLDNSKIKKFIVITGLALATSLTASSAQAFNLIFNGDFEDGNDGSFSSDSDFVTSITANNQYAINTSPKNARVQWGDFGDHTTGSGLMFLSSTETDNAWEQTVSVVAGQEYDFSGWFAVANAKAQTGSNFPIRFAVDGNIISSIDLSGDASGDWRELNATYTPSTSGIIELQLTNSGITNQNGRDWAADDLSFGGAAAVPFEFSPTLGLSILVSLYGISCLRRTFCKRG